MTAICAVLLGMGAATPAQAAFNDPLFFYTPESPLSAPCGIAVGSTGSFYVSDYYSRAVKAFGYKSEDLSKTKPEPIPGGFGAGPAGQNPHTGMVDDPCGLVFDSTGALYLNNYHRNVVRFPAPISLANPNNKVIDTGDPSNVYENPTGVAVNLATDHAYVIDRTYVAEYTSTGAFVQRIGEGSLEDGYGVAVSGFPATGGYLYVPDAATKTVKVFNPAVNTTTPIATIAKPGGFGSLIDSAIAVDNVTGEIYVVDTIGPQYTELPQAIVCVFNAAGVYEGRLKHATINAAPAGLAVDNSGTSTQSRVYLTSGIVEPSSIYAYPPHAASAASAPPLVFTGGGSGGSSAVGSASLSSASTSAVPLASTLASSSSAQGDVSPRARKAARKRHRRALRRRPRHRHYGRHAHRAKKERR